MNKNRIALGAGTALWLWATGAPLGAQTTASDRTQAPDQASSSDEASNDADSRLADIVVTATRQETILQRTPVAVTALSPQVLAERGVTNIGDLNSLAPSLSIGTRSGTGGGSGAITIRGIGVDANPPASPAVGIYVDEVYMPGTYGNLIGLFDVARVEVLRGPQGTLFGRNTISGAIQYVSVKPTLNDWSGFGQATVGSFDRRDFAAGVNVPLGSIAALRVSGALTHRDGYVFDALNKIDRGAETDREARAQLRIQPIEALTIDLKGEYLRQKTNGRATTNTDFNYATAFGGPFAPAGLDPFISKGYYTAAGFNDPDFFRGTIKIAQGAIAYALSDNVTVKSITAYSDTKTTLRVDQDGTPLPIIGVNRGDVQDRLFTQELQLSGHSFDRLHWTIGGYYYKDRLTSANAVSTIFGGPPSDPFGDYRIRTRSLAVYGQATFDITEQLAIVGGLRYTDEKVYAKDVLNPGSGRGGYHDTSPLIGIDFQATPDLLFYAKRSRGFRAGGFSPNSAGYFAYGPENAVTYEAGARMELLDHHLRVNPTLFTTDWKNIQFNDVAIVPGIPFPFPIISNAGDARIKGAEVEMQAQVTPRFSLTGSLSLLDAHYTRVGASQTGNLTLKSRLKRAPKGQFTIGARYVAPLGDMGDVTFSANYAHQSWQRSETSDRDFIRVPPYGLLSARIEWQSPDKMFSLAVFGTNLTDERYPIGGTNFGAGGAIPGVTRDPGRPRELGVTGRVNF